MPNTKLVIRLLHLEDSARDAAMVADLLEAEGGSYKIIHVANRKQFEAALKQPGFDLILCDYNLPDFDGLSALKLAKAKHPETPLIVVSGAIDSEEAVQCLKAGATDYLLKQRLERLPSAVKRALEETNERRQLQQAEQAVRDSQRYLSEILDSMFAFVVLFSPEGVVLEVNRAPLEAGGLRREEVLGQLFWETNWWNYSPEPQQRLRDVIHRVVQGQFVREDFELRMKGGHLATMDAAFTPLRDEAGRIVQVVVSGVDVTQRKRAEDALRESEERFRQLAEQSSEGFWFVRLNPEHILYVSPAVEKIWGRPAERFYQDSRHWTKSIHPDDQPRIRTAWEDCLQGRLPKFEAEYRVVRPDGSVCWVLDSGTPIRNAAGEIVRVSGVVRDISERKQAESQVLRTQRLESIGTLASGVAHDINNALAPIMMANELLRAEFPEQGARYLELIQSGTERAAEMIKQLLTFAKGAEGEKLLLQPRHLLKEMEKLIKHTFPKNIELRMKCAKDLHAILGNATQLHQVLLNLCVNARDAMPNGGTLTLAAENKEVDANYASAVTAAKPGQYVMLRVTDTGTGIPPEVLDRIFEPFFSTKGPDKGTGLGLSTVFGIVKAHGGFLRVYSTPGQGSTFSVYLPAACAADNTSWLTKADLTFRGNGETILVIDDEPDVCLVARDLLMDLNFKVICASDGIAALIQVAENREQLRAVITDLHMPRMDGVAFVRKLKAQLPSVPIIVASGQADEAARDEFKKQGVNAVIDKPFSQQELVKVLRTIFPN